ncbi:MAG TPA: RcnB family protein [Myxococcaceae bacterium]|nr:RcnB family protein [Myxococcaceae bacterium]
MKRIALLVAAGVLAYSPATFAKPPENGKGNSSSQASGSSKGNNSSQMKGAGKGASSSQMKGSGQGKAEPTRARNGGSEFRPAPVSRDGVVRQADAQWMYRGRTYDQFDVPAYRLPPGQAKKIFNQGERLPASYYAQNPTYIISNPAQYQLSSAPAGYRWVRVDNDVYLVRNETGVISEVVRRIFR